MGLSSRLILYKVISMVEKKPKRRRPRRKARGRVRTLAGIKERFRQVRADVGSLCAEKKGSMDELYRQEAADNFSIVTKRRKQHRADFERKINNDLYGMEVRGDAGRASYVMGAMSGCNGLSLGDVLEVTSDCVVDVNKTLTGVLEGAISIFSGVFYVVKKTDFLLSPKYSDVEFVKYEGLVESVDELGMIIKEFFHYMSSNLIKMMAKRDYVFSACDTYSKANCVTYIYIREKIEAGEFEKMGQIVRVVDIDGRWRRVYGSDLHNKFMDFAKELIGGFDDLMALLDGYKSEYKENTMAFVEDAVVESDGSCDVELASAFVGAECVEVVSELSSGVLLSEKLDSKDEASVISDERPYIAEMRSVISAIESVVWSYRGDSYEYPGDNAIVRLKDGLFVLNNSDCLKLDGSLADRVGKVFQQLRLVPPKAGQGLRFENGKYYLKIGNSDRRIFFNEVSNEEKTLLVMRKCVRHKEEKRILR
jgi:hypothetical protein